MSDRTEIVVLLDRSGSMASIKRSMEEGFNKFIAEQRETGERINVTLITFDDRYETIYRGKPIANVDGLIISPRGWTALYDSMERAIKETRARHTKMSYERRPSRVVFLTITDGQDNRSRLYAVNDVKELVKKQQDERDWAFVFIGANMDAVFTGQTLNIPNNFTYTANTVGTNAAWATVSSGTRQYLRGTLPSNEIANQASYDATVRRQSP